MEPCEKNIIGKGSYGTVLVDPKDDTRVEKQTILFKASRHLIANNVRDALVKKLLNIDVKVSFIPVECNVKGRMKTDIQMNMSMKKYDTDGEHWARNHPIELRLKEMHRIVLWLLSELTHIHDLGFIHGDIKPSNIVFMIDSKERTVYDCVFIDHGSVFPRTPEHGQFSMKRGTQVFCAPECFSNEEPEGYDRRAMDYFSLGASLYTMIFRKLICEGSLDRTEIHKLHLSNAIKTNIDLQLSKFSKTDTILTTVLENLMHPDFKQRVAFVETIMTSYQTRSIHNHYTLDYEPSNYVQTMHINNLVNVDCYSVNLPRSVKTMITRATLLFARMLQSSDVGRTLLRDVQTLKALVILSKCIVLDMPLTLDAWNLRGSILCVISAICNQ